jgi:hypothetical protein
MPRLRNELTGAVMSVEDSTAALLGSEWGSADKADEKPAARRKASASADSKTSE